MICEACGRTVIIPSWWDEMHLSCWRTSQRMLRAWRRRRAKREEVKT